jgi:hypothetical protein
MAAHFADTSALPSGIGPLDAVVSNGGEAKQRSPRRSGIEGLAELGLLILALIFWSVDD